MRSSHQTFVAVLCMLTSALLILGAIAIPSADNIETFGLVVETPVRDFGRLRQGDSVSASFQVRNTSTDTIELLDVYKSCDCTEATLSKEVLSPGDAATLSTTWQTRAARGKSAANLRLFYRLPDGQRHWQDIEMLADVSPDYHIGATTLEFDKNTDGRQVVTFSPGEMSNLAITRAYCTHRSFEARILREEMKVEVSFDPKKFPPSHPVVRLIVETNSPNQPKCQIHLLVLDSNKLAQ